MTQYLRLYPGEKDYREVSQKEWEAPYKFVAGWKGWGVIATMEADLCVWDRTKGVTIAKKWPSRSYIRNFARIMRNMFGENPQVDLVDINANTVTTQLQNTGQTDGGLLPEVFLETVTTGDTRTGFSGAGFGIGDGVAVEDHTRNDLVNRQGEIANARSFIRTSVLSTSTITLVATGAITNASSSSISVTEIGMYTCIRAAVDTISDQGQWTLLAYDGVTSTPVAVDGVAAPRYTLDYPV